MCVCIVPGLFAQSPQASDIILYQGVVYDISLLDADYQVESLTYVLQEIDQQIAKQYRKMDDARIHGVKIVADYYVINGAEIRKTPDQKFVLFLSELMVDDFRNIPRAVKGLEKLTESDIRGMYIQAKREENLNAILEGDDGYFDQKKEETWVGGLLKAQSNFVKGISDFINDLSGKNNVIVKDYHHFFDDILPKDLIEPYSFGDRKTHREANVYFEAGGRLFMAGDLDAALEAYKKAIWADPKFVEGYHHRALVFIEMKNFDRAFEDFNKALDLDNHAASIFNNRGDLYLLINNVEMAILDYSRAIDADPEFAEAYFNRGYAQDQRNYFFQALDDYTKALELVPNYAQSYSNRGYVYYKLKKYSKAGSDFSSAIEIDPNFGEAYSNRALIYYFQEAYEESWQDVIRCEALGVELDPQFLSTLEEVYPRP